MLYLFSSGLCVIDRIQRLMSTSLDQATDTWRDRLHVSKSEKKSKGNSFFSRDWKESKPMKNEPNQNLGFAKNRPQPESKNMQEPEMN